MTHQEWSRRRAPTLADIEALADAAYAALPKRFTRLCEGLVIRVEDFPDDETLNDMQCESEFDLLGLFRGRGLTQGAHLSETGEPPNMIWLYRRPIASLSVHGEGQTYLQPNRWLSKRHRHPPRRLVMSGKMSIPTSPINGGARGGARKATRRRIG